MPKGAADTFKAKLVINESDNVAVYPFWEGALKQDAKRLKPLRSAEILNTAYTVVDFIP